MSRPYHHESLPDALGNLTIGAGYVVRADGLAVALIDLLPPDLRLHDEQSLGQVLEQYTAVLRTTQDRCLLHTYAVPLDINPLIARLTTAQQHAPDVCSYVVLGALTDWMQHAWAALAHLRTVRWIVSVPAVAPETPPPGTWGELYPAHIVGQTTRLAGDPVTEALNRARRLAQALAALGTEPPPQLLTADAIRALLRATLDPIAYDAYPVVQHIPAPRPLQLHGEEAPDGI